MKKLFILLGAVAVAAGAALPARAADVCVPQAADGADAAAIRQVFRPERHQRGDTNVSRLQDIDDASWIWHPTAPSKGEVGTYAFLRFRKEFEADAAPLCFMFWPSSQMRYHFFQLKQHARNTTTHER